MSAKSDRKRQIKSAAREFLRGDGSAWQAHKGRRCLESCVYCAQVRVRHRPYNEERPTMVTGAQA